MRNESFCWDETKQRKNLIFIVVPQADQVPKVKKKTKRKKKKELKHVLLEPSFVME